MGAFYLNSIVGFVNDDIERIIGILTSKGQIAGFYQQKHDQTKSWRHEIEVLMSSLKQLIDELPSSSNWNILLEYPIARREKRIDVVIIAGASIVVIEYKGGHSSINSNSKEQLYDYCLDLRDFHFETRNKKIFPVLLSSDEYISPKKIIFEESVQPIWFTNPNSLKNTLLDISSIIPNGENIDSEKWNLSAYSPTPTIIEAAQTLFSGKSVEEISRSHAGTINLTKTTEAVIRAINKAKENKRKNYMLYYWCSWGRKNFSRIKYCAS